MQTTTARPSKSRRRQRERSVRPRSRTRSPIIPTASARSSAAAPTEFGEREIGIPPELRSTFVVPSTPKRRTAATKPATGAKTASVQTPRTTATTSVNVGQSASAPAAPTSAAAPARYEAARAAARTTVRGAGTALISATGAARTKPAPKPVCQQGRLPRAVLNELARIDEAVVSAPSLVAANPPCDAGEIDRKSVV